MSKKFFLIFCLMLCSIPLTADISFNNLASYVQTFWSDTNGLPSNRILDILQDEKGYIWLASYDGLIRFDGNDFTELTKEKHGFTGLSPRVLCEDVDGTLWVGTNSSGLYSYKNKKFKEYGLEEGLPNLSIRAIKFDRDNTLWVGTADGLVKMDKSGRFVPVLHEDKSLGIISFVQPLKDMLLIGSNLKGITTIQNEKIIKLPYLESIQEYTFSCAYSDIDGSVWFGTKDGKIFNLREEKITEFTGTGYLNGASINKFLRVTNGTMYVATNKGIITLTINETDIFSEENGLPNNIVSSLCLDIEENLWVGMEHGGVGKFSKGRFLDLTSTKSLPPAASNSVLEDSDKNIWIAKDDGLNCLKNDTLSEERSRHIDTIVSFLNTVRIRQIREEADGTLFFSTYSNKGLVIFHKDGTITGLTTEDGLPNNRVRFSYRGKDNLLWIGTTAGPAVYLNGKITNFTEKDGLPNLFILCAVQSSDGNVWLGTDGGGAVKLAVTAIDNDSPKIKTENVFTKADGLKGNIVFRIVEDKYGNIWFCTSEGLTLYKNGEFYSADAALGASGESTFNILPDELDNVWIVTPKELLLVKTEALVLAALNGQPAENLVRYNRLDGLTGQLTANAWGHVTKDNKLFVPTLKGVAVCDPTYYVSNKHVPPVVIENYILDDESFDVTDEKITVSPSTKRIMFKFTALSFTIPQRVYFEYKLEGYDTEWRSCGTTREIAYTNLNPGKYVFKVRATNNDGIVNKDGSEFEFYKRPFFHQTVWFYLILIIVLSGGIMFAVQLRIKNLQRRADELDRKVKEKTQELADEKEKSDKLLKNTLPLSIIDELIKTGKSKPKLYPAVSVLFADIVSFTEWSGNNSPETVIAELNRMFTHFDNIMDSLGCERIKTLGDGYLACCGLSGEKDHAEKLVTAAVQMLSAVKELNSESNQKFKIKIGIDSGEMTGGIVGERKYIFDIFGDVVNTTFRLEAVTIPMACTVSEKTAALISGKYSLYKRPSRNLKGKGVVTSYYVLYNNNNSTCTYSQIKKLYESLLENFKKKNYAESKKIIACLDKSILEPEMLRDIDSIEQYINSMKI